MAAIISHGSPVVVRWAPDRRAVGPSASQRHRPTAALYRRRRLTVLALAIAALAAGGLTLSAPGGGSLTTSGVGSPPPARIKVQTVSRSTHVVAPGDTLWSIARHLQPEGDIRPLVDALAGSRDGRPLQVGEPIRLP